MSAEQSRVSLLYPVRVIVAPRGLWRMATLLFLVLAAQVIPLSSRLPVGGSDAVVARAAALPPITTVSLPTITTVSFSGTPGLDGSVTVTVSGQNFGSEPPADGTPGSLGYTGQNFGSALALAFTDNATAAPAPWSAGQTGNHVGLVVSQYSDTSISYSFGDAYGPTFPSPSDGYYLSAGDPFTVYVAGMHCSGIVSFSSLTTCAPPLINIISFGNAASNPTITVYGSGFGSSLPAPTVSGPVGSGAYAGQTFTGDDYTCGVLSLSFAGTDAGESGPASAGNVCPTDGQTHYDYLGLLVAGYSDAQIQFSLGSFYALNTPGGLNAGSQFTLTVAGVTCTGTVSYTAPIYCQNSTWLAAQTLSQTSGSYQVNQTVSQSIYGAVTERWYRFLVTPGSSVHVQYSGVPGAVLSLHSDMQSAYNSLSNPTSAAVSTKDAASGFLPQGFLPQGFLPQGFLPQGFLPQGFLPQGFLPQGFLPQGFLPQGFLPQGFLPQGFLPQGFLPQGFLPQGFLPQGFLPGPYSDVPYTSLLAVSATPNSAVQTIDHNTWNSFGYMYVRVAAPPSAAVPFTLTVTESGGVCAGVTNIPATPPAPSSIPTRLTTLILWDSTRIAGSASDVSTLSTKLSTFASRSEVHGAVIDLSTIPGIDGTGSAQQQADNNPACPTAKNLVANDIKSVVQVYRDQNPGLQYVVLAGDDHSIPFFRYPDESGLGLENQYYPPVADSSAANASLRDNYVLGQDEYGASLDLPLSDVSLPIPDLAVGRLVKTAAEVSHMLDVYTNNNGLITPSSSLVTGYDFVADAATTAQSELQLGTNVTPDTLISAQGLSPSASWTANDLRQKLFGSRHDVVFLAGHFSAGNLEAADYATTVSAAAVASSAVDMSNSLILALGCHGGYTIPGTDAVPSLSPAPDWPEAMAEKGATLLSSTGYAYGDTVLTEYGEHLFDNYVRQLRSYSGSSYLPVAVGQAEVAAKKEYLATHTNLTGVDQKTLLETTLYGLPMLQVNMTGTHVNTQPDTSIITSAPTGTSAPGSQFNLTQTAIDVQPALTPHTVTLTNSATNASVTATYLTGPNNGEVARPGEPIFPSQRFNVHVANQILRGVGFRGGTYTDTANITPLSSAVSTETSVGHPAFYSSVFYPTQVWGANFFDASGGGSERLATTPAQYMSASAGSTYGTLRQFSDLQFSLFYLPSNWATTSNSTTVVAAAPVIGGVSATRDSTSGNVTFNVHVLSDQSAGTQGVWITYTGDPNNPGKWLSIDLSQNGADPTLWTATSTQSLPSTIVFMVQAASGTGLVSLSTNAGAFYTVGGTPPRSAPTTLTVQQAPATGVYQSTSRSFTVKLVDGNGAPLANQAVTLQLGSQQAIATTGSDGTAGITVPLNQPPGSYAVVATFAGGTTYQATSSAAGTFTITPESTALALAPASGASVAYNGTAPIVATLTDHNGNGLVQRTVVFTVAGNGITQSKTAITDYLGRAALGPVQLSAGTYSVTAAFGGADSPVQIAAGGSTITLSDPEYLSAGASAMPLTITRATPKLTWPTPAAIVFGTKLGAAQLNATAADPTTGSALPGTFSYTPAAGAVLDVGSQTLTVTFTPTDGADYTTASTSVSLQVVPIPLLKRLIVLDAGSASCTLLIQSGSVTAGTVAVNGTSSAAACLNGGALTASTIAVQGGMRNQGGTVQGTVTTHAPPAADPFAVLPVPAAPPGACPGSACPGGPIMHAGAFALLPAPAAPHGSCPGSACPGGPIMHAGTFTLNPGTYSQAVILNGGATACLKSGIYVLNGSWTINGGSKLVPCSSSAPGVLLYFRGGGLLVNGGGSVSGLTGMTGGDYTGLLYWQVDGSTATLNGGVSVGGGAWYAPGGTLLLNGGSALTVSALVTNDLTVHGGATLTVH